MTIKFTEPMVASKKMKYATRHMVAGDEFFVERRHIRALEGSGKAKRGRKLVDLAPPPKSLAAKAAAIAPAEPVAAQPASAEPAPAVDSDIAALRAEYAEKLGRRPFPGWDAAELRRRMAAETTEA